MDASLDISTTLAFGLAKAERSLSKTERERNALACKLKALKRKRLSDLTPGCFYDGRNEVRMRESNGRFALVLGMVLDPEKRTNDNANTHSLNAIDGS